MIFQGDLRIKAAITLGLEDISKNQWLVNDILADTVSNEHMRRFYGTQIESCKQWLTNNRINIFLSERDDKVEFPSIIIELGTSNEKSDMKHMGDLSTESVNLLPNDINKPIPYVVKPAMGSYNSTTGIFTFSGTIDLSAVVQGMIVVNPITSVGYVIQSVASLTEVNLLPGMTIIAGSFGVIPQYQYYETKISHTFMQETYRVSCHCLDQQTLLWLHSIVVYSLLRYRQTLLEKDGFAESLISSGKMYPNGDYSDAGQVIWSRDINLTGQVENRWLNQPHRIIEDTLFPNGGIKIISNITNTFEDPKTVNWETIQDFVESQE